MMEYKLKQLTLTAESPGFEINIIDCFHEWHSTNADFKMKSTQPENKLCIWML